MPDKKLGERLRQLLIEGDVVEIEKLTALIRSKHSFSRSEFLSLHDALQFTIAYSPSKEINENCRVLLSQLVGKFPKKINGLQDSGITGSGLITIFSLELLVWMYENYPDAISFHSFNQEKKDIGEEMKLLFPSAEAEVFTFGWSKSKLFRYLCGGKITVERLLQLFQNNSDKALSSFVFNKAEIYIEVDFSNKIISRSTAQSVSYEPCFHSEILKKIDASKIISTPLPALKKLSKEEINNLLTNSRMMLASLGRETDPITNCAQEETEFYILERGFSIALFYLSPKYRLAFDSYVGYMMYKNGMPVSYGGAWIFFDRALIGINIFDAYRGGESGFLFSQLLRSYSQRFKVNTFSVEPYQYGKGNPEGIESGAYWFYYRFGFRSDNLELRALAEEEQKKISSNKSYKSPKLILKQFTNSNISLQLKNKKGISSSELSMKITDKIAKEFGGNRVLAIKKGDEILKKLFGTPTNKNLTKETWKNWCLAIQILNPKMKPNSVQKKNFHTMILSKAIGSESKYLDNLKNLEAIFEI